MHVQSEFSRYLKSTPREGVLFCKLAHLKIEDYTDIDWTSNINDHRSTSSCCTSVGGDLVTHT